MQIKSFFLFLVSLLALSVNSFASELKDKVSFGFNTYSDNGDVQVYSPTFALFKKVSSEWMVGIKMRVDAITAASISNGSNPTTVDAVTSASSSEDSINDKRFAPTMMATYESGDDVLTFGGYYSSEIDYEGKAFFVTYVRQLNEQNTALSIGISQSADKWKPVFDRNLPRDNRDEGKIDLSISQLISPIFSVQAVYSHMSSKGFLSSPYHYVLQDDLAKFENYKSSREGDAFAVSGVYMINEEYATNFSYRYYTDDWGIDSHTVNGELLKDFASNLTSGIRVRYYTQTKSDFSKDVGTYTLDDEYFASDYRMSAFDSYTVGIPLIYRPDSYDDVKITASIDFYQTSDNDYIKNWYKENNLQAIFTTFNVEYGF